MPDQSAALLPLEQSLTPHPVDAGVRIGHVHLKVADLDRALAFYCGVLGFELTQRYGNEAAFISAGGYHHHIVLNTWESRGGSPPPRGATLAPQRHLASRKRGLGRLGSCRRDEYAAHCEDQSPAARTALAVLAGGRHHKERR